MRRKTLIVRGEIHYAQPEWRVPTKAEVHAEALAALRAKAERKRRHNHLTNGRASK